MSDSKTEILVFHTRYYLNKHTISSLRVGELDIINNKNIKLLGVIMDPHLTFKDDITNKSKLAFKQIITNT